MFTTLHPSLARALAERSYTEATAVQTAVLTEDAAGRDLLVSAQTGSGKTVAYGLALGETLLGPAERLEPAAEPLALIVAPTRELALQVQREIEWLYRPAGARVVSCVGGMDPKSERRKLQAGVHIVVGTPGRLRDHIERGGLDVSRLKAVVLDEADEMLDLGFREDLEFILDTTPGERRTLLFSATMPRAIAAMARRYQRDAARIEVRGSDSGHADIEYRAVRIVPNETDHAVVNLLRYFDAPGTLIFCNTRNAVRHLQATLSERGFSVVALSGELSQNERNHALQALRDGRARVCVATDVAARGIDLPSLGLVIHAELPNDPEVLQHRSGRTGRAGRKGTSVLLVPLSRRRKAESLLAAARVQPVWSGPPTIEEIAKLDQERLLRDPLLLEEATEDDAEMAAALLAARTPEQIASALVRVWRSHLPSPEEVFDPGEARNKREMRDRGPNENGPNERGGAQDTRPSREAFAGSAWFHMAIGRRDNADPKWLLPLICRRGNVTRQDIGAIRIFDRETKFEVSAAAAARFAHAVRKSDGDIDIQPLADKSASAPAPSHAPHRKPGKRQRPDGDHRPPRKDAAVKDNAKKKKWKKKRDRPA
ncbi:DEAD/DEAH box helicase [Terrihabitans soli]|uniref:DEAD/DEAH box helicase n=1 Tax=Terrihabitans soli TaxID=708113 RepID=A0A6S6QSK0_9HYPH|nr:DEAD/DEAH box helicase [Terrihabitans soli]BCJ92069.1 DEAD/DEAH box helicase [Terrihabitans soli]